MFKILSLCLILISYGLAQEVTITKCLGSAWLNFNIIKRGPQQIHMTDLSIQLKTGDKCEAKACGDLILSFYKSFTHDFNLTRPTTLEGDDTPIGQYICDTIGMDFSGYMSLNEDYACSDMSETNSRIETPIQVNVCCLNAKFTTVANCKST